MERAALPLSNAPDIVFHDGLGDRRHVVDPTGHELSEVLSIRAELAAVPSFEFALRERVSRLAGFRHAAFGRVRSVERFIDRDATLAVLSEYTDGTRLSEILANAEARQVPIDINAALCLIRQLLPAIVALHENARDVAHGAIGPERLIVTPGARLIVVEYVAGAALEQLRFSRERYWSELRIAVPRTAGLARFDHRVDVTQIGALALSLILGRLLTKDDYPARAADLVSSAWAVSVQGGFEPLLPGLRAWLTRALQLDARSGFATARDAQDDFENVLGGSEYLATAATLEQFLARYLEAGPDEPVKAPTPVVWNQPLRSPAPTVNTVTTVTAPTPVAVVSPTPVPPQVAARVAASAAAAPVAVKTQPPEDAGAVLDFAPEKKSSSKRVSAGDTVSSSGDTDESSQTERPSKFRNKYVAGIAAALVLVAVAAPFGRRYFSTPPVVPVTTGTLTLNSNPEGAAVIVDGEARGKTPLTVSLSAGPHNVELLSDGASRVVPVTITAGAETSQYIELPKAAATKGQLLVRTEPSGAQVTVDGVGRGVSPATIGDLAPGEHTVVVAGGLGSVRQKVTIESGATASLFIPLEAPVGAPVSGWVSIDTPVEVQVLEGGKLIGTSQSDRILMSTGRHELDLVSESLGYRVTRTIQVATGKVSPIKLEMPKGTLSLNAAPWAEVWVDGEKQGETPIGNLSIAIGSHSVVFRHPELGEQHHTAQVGLKGTTRLSVDLRKK
jgi:serine/threonine protein kinase